MVKTTVDVIKELLATTKKILVNSKTLPFHMRMLTYLFLIIAFIVILASAAFCVIMIWSLIEVINSGVLFDNEPAVEWDIR